MINRFAILVLAAVLVLAGPLAPVARADETTRQVQEELRKRNLYFGDIDGRGTPALAAALEHYQQRKGFAASGAATDETLRSLNLLPPSAEPPMMPDVPVLRSDAGRLAAVTVPAPESAAAAPVWPPPAGAHITQVTPLSSDEARLFVERYLLAGQTNNPAAEAQFYADKVDYFCDGAVSRRFIEADIRRYDARWPERYFTLEGPVRIVSGADPASPVQVEVTYRFINKGRKYSVHGRVKTTYTLMGDRPEALRIVRVKEQRLRH